MFPVAMPVMRGFAVRKSMTRGVVFDSPGDFLHVVGVVGVCPAVLGAAEV